MADDWDLALAWLYVPANRTDRFHKAAAAADGVVIDLEDAVHPAERAAARDALGDALGDGLDSPTVVRINPPSHPDFDRDIETVGALVQRGAVDAIRVAKVESAQEAQRVADATAAWGIDRRLICQLESAYAVSNAGAIAGVDGVHSLMLGEADLRADLGLPRGGNSDAGLAVARGLVVLAAKAAGLPAPLASAYTNVSDGQGLAANSRMQRDLGFLGRSCIHPSQVTIVRAAFQPTPADVLWADGILERAEAMTAATTGVATLSDGSFIDAPIIAQARTIRARAERMTR